MHLYDYLTASIHKHHLAIVSRKEHITYGDLLIHTDMIALALQHAGIQPGDRVGILADTSTFWVASYLAIMKIGAIAAPFPSRLTQEQCTTFLHTLQCAALCIDHTHLTKYQAALPSPSITITPATPNAPFSLINTHPLPTHIQQRPPQMATQEHNLAALMFTSGSTGQPNAVKMSHENIIANTESILTALDLQADDRMLVVLPFDYCFGASLLHTHLRLGATLVLNTSFLFIEDVVQDLQTFQCTGFAGVPTIYQQLLRRSSFPHHPFPHLRHVQQAGGALAPIFIQEFVARLPHVRFFVMYGQTEATARLSVLQPDHLPTKIGSIGQGIPGVTLHVLDHNGNAVQPGQEGEIVAEGANVASGYWVPDPLKHSFRDGKLYTGDRATVDEDGFIYLTGRSSDFIKPHGHRVSCKEIEDVLAEMPAVVEAAVIGIQDSEQGEIPKAFLVTRDHLPLSLDDVITHCKKKLPSYAIPRDLAFLTDLPKNSAQKILKQLLPKHGPHVHNPAPTPERQDRPAPQHVHAPEQ